MKTPLLLIAALLATDTIAYGVTAGINPADDLFWGNSVSLLANTTGGTPITGGLPASLVQSWIDNPSSNHGVALLAVPNTSGNIMLFAPAANWMNGAGERPTLSFTTNVGTYSNTMAGGAGTTAMIKAAVPNFNEPGSSSNTHTPLRSDLNFVLWRWDVSNLAGQTIAGNVNVTAGVNSWYAEGDLSFNVFAIPVSWNQGTVTYGSLVVPEPSTYAAFAGLAILALAYIRRRK